MKIRSNSKRNQSSTSTRMDVTTTVCGEQIVAMDRALSSGHQEPFTQVNLKMIAAMALAKSSTPIHRYITESGAMIRRRARENSLGSVAPNMSDSSETTKCMEAVHSLGKARLASRANGVTTRRTDVVRCNIRTEAPTSANGRMTSVMVWERCLGPMVRNMKESLRKMFAMVKESTHGLTNASITAIGRMVNAVVMERSNIPTAVLTKEALRTILKMVTVFSSSRTVARIQAVGRMILSRAEALLPGLTA